MHELFNPSEINVINAMNYLSSNRIEGSYKIIEHFLRAENFEIQISAVKAIENFGFKKSIPLLRAYPHRPVVLHVMMPHAKCSMAR